MEIKEVERNMRIVGFGQDGDLNLTNVIIEDDGREYWFENPRWISVEERLPESKEDVALHIRCGDVSFIRTGWRMGNGQFICQNDSLSGYEVTHWMPLPPMPKEEA